MRQLTRRWREARAGAEAQGGTLTMARRLQRRRSTRSRQGRAGGAGRGEGARGGATWPRSRARRPRVDARGGGGSCSRERRSGGEMEASERARLAAGAGPEPRRGWVRVTHAVQRDPRDEQVRCGGGGPGWWCRRRRVDERHHGRSLKLRAKADAKAQAARRRDGADGPRLATREAGDAGEKTCHCELHDAETAERAPCTPART